MKTPIPGHKNYFLDDDGFVWSNRENILAGLGKGKEGVHRLAPAFRYTLDKKTYTLRQLFEMTNRWYDQKTHANMETEVFGERIIKGIFRPMTPEAKIYMDLGGNIWLPPSPYQPSRWKKLRPFKKYGKLVVKAGIGVFIQCDKIEAGAFPEGRLKVRESLNQPWEDDSDIPE